MFHLKFQGDWPWKKDLTGRCSCEIGYYFDDNTGSCTTNGVPEDELDFNPTTEYSKEDSKSFIDYTASINSILRFIVF